MSVDCQLFSFSTLTATVNEERLRMLLNSVETKSVINHPFRPDEKFRVITIEYSVSSDIFDVVYYDVVCNVEIVK